MYPNLMDYADLFDFSDKPLPYVFVPRGPVEFDLTQLGLLRGFVDNAMDGYFPSYMRKLQTIPPEWLSHLGSIAGTSVFLGYRSEFVDWAVYEETVARRASSGNAIILPGAYWWQYRSMPTRCAESVRNIFKIIHKDKQTSRKQRMSNEVCGIKIGVHVRRGDYIKYRGGEYYWSLDIYVDIMQAISMMLGSQPHLFVLCSNDNWSETQLAGLPCCYEQGSSYDDFVALSACNYVIGPPSTYANWASFLGKSRRLVITPSLLPQVKQLGLELAVELDFPTGSRVPEDFWVMEH